MRPVVSWLGALASVGVLALTTPALGQDADELARKHFESGVAYLQESDYENALKAFEKSYELSKRPEILLNIATVNERRNDLKAAIAALEKFLQTAPESDQRQTTEARLANLKKRLGDEPAPPTTPPATTPPPTTSDGQTAPPTVDQGAQPAPEQKANIPAYVLLGLGAVSAGAAILTGVLAKGEYDDAKDSCSPNCTDDDLKSGRTLALTSTVLTGVAVVSASIGAVLLFTSKSDSEKVSSRRSRRTSSAPRVFLGIAPSGAMAGAGWGF
jgi:hypothetical protein